MNFGLQCLRSSVDQDTGCGARLTCCSSRLQSPPGAAHRLKSPQDTADCVGGSGDRKGHRPSWDLSCVQLVPAQLWKDESAAEKNSSEM